MNILGVVAHTLGYGDAGAALAVDGRIVGAIEEERFSRKRYDDSFPANAVKSLLDMGGIKGGDVDLVALHLHPYKGLPNRLYWMARHFTQTIPHLRDYWRYYRKYGNLRKEMTATLGTDRARFEYFGHHECHAAAVFYSSSFEESAFLTLDGSGEGITGSYGMARRGQDLETRGKFPYPHSLGIAYCAVCNHIGFSAPSGPGKVMGLAAYGDPERFLHLLRNMIRCKNGNLRLALEYFQFHKNMATPIRDESWMSHSFAREFGHPRRLGGETLEQDHIDLAAALQTRTNEVGVALARHVARTTESPNLCLGGGVALNSVMNGAIEEDGAFENLFLQPAPGDSGNALGSVYLASLAHGVAIPPYTQMPYAGPVYDNAAIEAELRKRQLPYRPSDRVAMEAARAVKDGLIVGWFQGRMEFGPRALGCRSILADPQRKNMKEILNARVKHREWFRPFAPSVACEAYSRYFTGPEDNPFMLLVSRVRDTWKEVFPAITHADGTARVQSVTPESNPKYYELLQSLGEISGHPVVLNTSFNDKEPIVCTPSHAIDCFLKTDIDRLFIGDFVVESKAK